MKHSTLHLTAAGLGLALTLVAPAPGVDWVQPTAGVSIATDGTDNVYTVNFTYALGAEMTLTKRDAAGNLLWEASHDQTEPTKWERAEWIATDHAGNAVVCGTLMSGYSNPVTAASIVMKFSPEGALLWRHVYETSFDGSYTRRCLVDGADNVYVLAAGSGPPGFVTKIRKFAPDGTPLWTWFDAAGIGAPVNFKLTPDGQLVVVGRAIFGSINGYARLDREGQVIWSYPGVNSLTVGDAAGDASGNTYLVHGEYVVSGGTVIKKVNPSGALLWEHVYSLAGFRVEVGSDNRAVVSGFPNAGTPGAAFVKVDEAGGMLWSNMDADGPLGLLLHAHMLMDESNSAYLAAGTLFEMAVCKVTSDGASAWTKTAPGGYARAIAFGHDQQSVFVVGGTTARLSNPSPVQGDVNGDGAVNVADLVEVVLSWGACPPGPATCPADLNGDGMVDVADLVEVVLSWAQPAARGSQTPAPVANRGYGALSCVPGWRLDRDVDPPQGSWPHVAPQGCRHGSSSDRRRPRGAGYALLSWI